MKLYLGLKKCQVKYSYPSSSSCIQTFRDVHRFCFYKGFINLEKRDEWKKTLDDLAKSGDFYYGIVYHRVAGRHG